MKSAAAAAPSWRQMPPITALVMGACLLGILCLGISSAYDMLMGGRVERVVAVQLRLMQSDLSSSAGTQAAPAGAAQLSAAQHSSNDSHHTADVNSVSSSGGNTDTVTMAAANAASQHARLQRRRSRASRRSSMRSRTSSSDSSSGNGSGGSSSHSYKVRFHPNVDQLLQDQKQLNYTCYEPTAGLSTPVVTIITIINLKYPHHQAFIHNHRLAYAVKHGYRYCEQQHTDPSRTGPAVAFARIALSLAILPCSHYLFHADGDSLFFNQEATMDPLIEQMESSNVDLLATADIIRESPINFGVYMLRPADWLWQMFKVMFNHCACDWSRLNDWPSEQGLFYDLLASTRDTQPWANRTRAIKATNWNHLYHLSPATGKELLLHLTGMPEEKAQPCEGRMDCKHKGIEMYWNEAVRDKKVPNITVPGPDAYKTAPNSCQLINFKSLVRKDDTYSNVDGRYSSSFLDFQPNGQGRYDLLLGEIACIGYRDKKCKLERYWDTKKGTGPDMQMMRSREEVVQFFNADGSPRRRAAKPATTAV